MSVVWVATSLAILMAAAYYWLFFTDPTHWKGRRKASNDVSDDNKDETVPPFDDGPRLRLHSLSQSPSPSFSLLLSPTCSRSLLRSPLPTPSLSRTRACLRLHSHSNLYVYLRVHV